jgi:uncharacterized repeat protein (TIGR03803 family)
MASHSTAPMHALILINSPTSAVAPSGSSTPKNNFSTLVTFTGAQNGADPYGNLTLREDVLYGDTFTGGASNLGTVFKVKTDGTGFKLLYTFTDPTLGTHPDSFLRLEIFGNMFSETRMAEKATQGLTLPAMACCSS